MENLQEVLGKELYTQVSEKLGDKDLFIHTKGQKVLIDDGSYVKKEGMIPKDRFDAVNAMKNEYEEKVNELTTQLTTLSEQMGDKDKYKKQVTDLMANMEALKTESTTKTELAEKRFVLRDALREAGGRHVDMLESKFDLSTVHIENGRIKEIKNGEGSKDWATYLKDFKTSYSDMFGELKRSGAGAGQGGQPDGLFTMEEIKANRNDTKWYIANSEKVEKSLEYYGKNN